MIQDYKEFEGESIKTAINELDTHINELSKLFHSKSTYRLIGLQTTTAIFYTPL